MDQQTQAWLDWRKKGIGASESAQILERSPYGSRLDLWLLKTGRVPEGDFSTYANAKGGDTEHNLRSRHSIFKKRDFQPRLAEHDEFPFILASLDAYDEIHKEGCEIKFVSKEKFDNDFISDHHMIQMQHQMLVVGVPEWEYLMSCDNGSTYKAIVVQADKKLQKLILKKCIQFQKYVTDDKRPPLGPNDYRQIKDKKILALLFEWKRAKADGKSKVMKDYKDQIVPLLKHKKMRGLDVDISSGRFYSKDANLPKSPEPAPEAEPNPQS